MDFYVENALKLTYEHLGYQKIFTRFHPRGKRKSKVEKGKEEKEGEGEAYKKFCA